MKEQSDVEPWYAVRCVFRHGPEPGSRGDGVFEERITLWRAASFDEAVARAEEEATAYAEGACEYLALAQAFHLFVSGQVGDGDEVLMRDSALPPDEYETHFFDTRREHQRHVN